MWPFRKKRLLNRELEAANRAFLAAVARVEQIPYDGDAFKPNPVDKETIVTDPQVNEKALARFEVDRLPTLVSASVDSLVAKKNDLEQELKVLKSTYELNKGKLNEKLNKVKLSIRAWEAAQAVYKDAEQATIEHEANPAPVNEVAPIARAKTRARK